MKQMKRQNSNGDAKESYLKVTYPWSGVTFLL